MSSVRNKLQHRIDSKRIDKHTFPTLKWGTIDDFIESCRESAQAFDRGEGFIRSHTIWKEK